MSKGILSIQYVSVFRCALDCGQDEAEADGACCKDECVALRAENERLRQQVMALTAQVSTLKEQTCALAKQCDAQKQMPESSSQATENACVSVTEEAAPRASFMDLAVEVADQQLLALFADVLHAAAAHGTTLTGNSLCDDLRQRFRIIRVLRIENRGLWNKYSQCTRRMKCDLAEHGIEVAALVPTSPSPLHRLQQLHQLDEALNERYLFHGTTLDRALQIAQQGFDFRLSKPGYYGQGTYFTSHSCKAHGYTSSTKGTNARTMLLCRVAVGDPFYAQKVSEELHRPEIRKNTHSVVANPGPMAGHLLGMQAHQEIVVFDQFQAYPEFVIQYTS